MVEREYILGFDQAPTHVGWSLLDYRADKIVEFGGELLVEREGNAAAARYVTTVTIAQYVGQKRNLVAVALEGAYYGPQGWRIAAKLTELRGRIIGELAVSCPMLRIEIIEPHEWQRFIGVNFQKSKVVKLASMRLASGFVRPEETKQLNEDICDSVHIARKMRARLLEEELASRVERRTA